MRLQPRTLSELQATMAQADERSERISSIELSALHRFLEHVPEDMTATVETGRTLSGFQGDLSKHKQWLPADPPHPDRLTIRELLDTNASGPRRLGYGTVRDYLIGMKVVLANGRLIKAGGKVVKNVAGYDLGKLFIGSQGSLGVIVEATFKLRPFPEKEAFVQAEFSTLEQADGFVQAVLASDLTPIVLDLHHRAPIPAGSSPAYVVVVGFAGSSDEVQWELVRARELGAGTPSTLDYHRTFWSDNGSPVHRISTMPSELAKTIAALGPIAFVAHAGNGVVWYRGGPAPGKEDLPGKLFQRVKDAYDPRHILPELPS